MLSTREQLLTTDFPPLRRGALQTLQVNLGYLCNQQCLHCHVNAGPNRTEAMSADGIVQVLDFLKTHEVSTLDLTGGAPELNPHFRELVHQAGLLGVHVIDRCNLTVLEEDGQQDLAVFLAEHRVEITASLPCYLQENVDRQRGKGVFGKSIRGLQCLNALGYGKAGSELVLNLVFNPQGAQLPPAQQQLEQDYRSFLMDKFQVEFTQLYTLTNMPILRFGSTLLSKGEFEPYMQLLRDSYQPANLDGVMCRSMISVDWQGYLYDCDFNQMLDMPLQTDQQSRIHLSDCMDRSFNDGPVKTGEHCYGCTAGQGSSCGGALK